jgi:probable rRNA maturation factor
MFATLQLGNSEISIVLTNDEQIQQLNRIYRHVDRPTDVLAFAMHEGEAPHLHAHILGDVVVSVDTARTQAKRAKRRVLSETTMLIAHGILHLLGWDHETRAKDRRMRAETARLCGAATSSRRGGPRRRQARREPSENPSALPGRPNPKRTTDILRQSREG